jgi:ABC-type multidrug transport system permease subunit
MDFYFQNRKINLMRKIFFVFLLFFPLFILAQGGIVIPNPLKATSVEALVDSIINFVFYLAIAIAPLMWIIAGFLLGVSAGDPEKVNTAKRIALYTAIGFFVVMLAKALVSVVRRIGG